MIFAYLVLAHLLGDFVFQPSKLVKWKMTAKKGIIVHSFIHLVFYFFLLLPFFFTVKRAIIIFIISLGLAFSHFIIDESKISYDLKHDKKVGPFIVDQLIHLISIIIAYLILNYISIIIPIGKFYEIYTNQKIILFLILAIFFTTVIEIFRFQKKREKNSTASLKFNIKELFIRLFTLGIVYLAFVALIKVFNSI